MERKMMLKRMESKRSVKRSGSPLTGFVMRQVGKTAQKRGYDTIYNPKTNRIKFEKFK